MSASAAAASASSPITFTLFEDVYAKEKQEFADHEWQALVALIREPRRSYESKSACPLISLAEYGEQRTDHQSLRHAANVTRVWGVEGDYDGETTPLGFAAEKLQRANIKAVVYSSPSNSKEKPRWRVIAPLSESHLPEKRAEYLGRINRVLGGILAPESFTLSQAYFVGRVRGRDYESAETTGRCVDLAIDIEPLYPTARPTSGRGEADPRTDQELRDEISRGENRQHAMLSLSGRLAARGMSADDIAAELGRLLDGNPDAKSEHWADLRERVPRLAATAVSKFSDPREQSPEGHWPSPSPLPDGLPVVEAFDYEIVPPILRRAIQDIAERMQCPPDFPAVALIIELSSIIGRRRGISPKRSDDWTVIPNLWGMVIGRPGIMKSPPLQEVMRPLRELETRAREDFDRDRLEFQAARMLAEQSEKLSRDAIRKELEKGNRAGAMEKALDATSHSSDGPTCRRYIVNDTSVEKLGELLNQNPQGVLLFRDELAGFFRTLERQGHEADRAFYLESWNGDGSFTYDRIGRGTIHIAAACLSVIGSIQPGPLSDLVRGLRGSGDDGLLQRFQLAVWPDISKHWRNIDRAPDRATREEIASLIGRLNALPADPTAPIPALRFDAAAQDLFDAWRERLENRLRADGLHPMVEAHVAKYRSLVPSLALILHLAESADGPVGLLSLERAIAWATYLESHAKRIYAPAISPDMDSARELTAHIEKGDVNEMFSLRDIYRCGWTSLSSPDEAAAAVRVLEDFDWLRSFQEATQGRKRTYYRLNPAVLSKGGLAA